MLRHFGPVEVVRNLDQDPGAVTHQLVGTDRTAVVEVFQDLQTLFEDGVRAAPLDVRDKADPAGVVFVGAAVQAMGSGVLYFFRRCAGHGDVLFHHALQVNVGITRRILQRVTTLKRIKTETDPI